MDQKDNRKDFDVSYKISLNTDTINECINEIKSSKIEDKKAFYTRCVMERFDKCNNNYVKDFDESLNKIYRDICDNDYFDFREFKKLLKYSMKLNSELYNNYVSMLCSIQNSK